MPSLSILSDAELKFYFANAAKRNELPVMSDIILEMQHRGLRCSQYYRFFKWNRNSVREILEPFAEISQGVKGNQRKAYTECGGSIFQKLDGNDKHWINAYSAIKRGKVNATFSVRVLRPGMEATFALSQNGEEFPVHPNDISKILVKWLEIAERAASSQ